MTTPELAYLTKDELPQVQLKAAFFDIDGTLLSYNGDYSNNTREQIKRLQMGGVKTAIASGRPFFAAQYLINELGLSDPGVFCTGAHIFRPDSKETMRVINLELDVGLRLRSRLRDSSLYYELYSDVDYYVETDRLPELRDEHAHHLRQAAIFKDFEELLHDSPVIKFLAAVDNKNSQRELYSLEKEFPECHFAYAHLVSRPDWLFVSITSKKACKIDAFDYLLDYHQISASEVICFGDAQSDMVFLEKAGIGVAMGNASEEVKAVANFVTKPVWEDGVAYAISRFLDQ